MNTTIAIHSHRLEREAEADQPRASAEPRDPRNRGTRKRMDERPRMGEHQRMGERWLGGAWRGVALASALAGAGFLLLCSGCTTAKVFVTPLTVARDVVDMPVVTLTNFLDLIAINSGGPSAQAGPHWSWRGGFDFSIGLNLAGVIFKTLAVSVGAVDYVACRSIWPESPWGLSPFKKKGKSWWSLYFPSTRALWAAPKKAPETPPPPAPSPAPASAQPAPAPAPAPSPSKSSGQTAKRSASVAKSPASSSSSAPARK